MDIELSQHVTRQLETLIEKCNITVENKCYIFEPHILYREATFENKIKDSGLLVCIVETPSLPRPTHEKGEYNNLHVVFASYYMENGEFKCGYIDVPTEIKNHIRNELIFKYADIDTFYEIEIVNEQEAIVVGNLSKYKLEGAQRHRTN